MKNLLLLIGFFISIFSNPLLAQITDAHALGHQRMNEENQMLRERRKKIERILENAIAK